MGEPTELRGWEAYVGPGHRSINALARLEWFMAPMESRRCQFLRRRPRMVRVPSPALWGRLELVGECRGSSRGERAKG